MILTFNTHDAEALEAILGEPPDDLVPTFLRSDEIAPGFVKLEVIVVGTATLTNVVTINEFDPLAAGIILGRFAQQDDRAALLSWPGGTDSDFEAEAYLGLVGCSDTTVKNVARTYALMVELGQAITDAAIDAAADPDTLLDGPPFISHEDEA